VDDHAGYALLDCGDRRRLEAFGPLLVDRPAPGAPDPRRSPEGWTGAAVFHPGSGWWHADGTPLGDDPIVLDWCGVTLEIRPSPSGQVGVFPEHAVNLEWLADAIRGRTAAIGATGATDTTDATDATDAGSERPEVLNLFAYTGLATLVAVRAGAAVVHVDAARSSVQWARRNTERSGLAEGPIRWITDDALDFVRREARRGRRYAA